MMILNNKVLSIEFKIIARLCLRQKIIIKIVVQQYGTYNLCLLLLL